MVIYTFRYQYVDSITGKRKTKIKDIFALSDAEAFDSFRKLCKNAIKYDLISRKHT